MGSKYVGSKIKEWRIGSGKSVAHICLENNIQPSSWYKWENGNTIKHATVTLLHTITKLDIPLLSEMVDDYDKELEDFAKEYNKTHHFKIDNVSKIRFFEVLKRPYKKNK